jgi:hypothetical protein
MHPLDFDEPFDPDSWSEKLWAQVPELRWDLRFLVNPIIYRTRGAAQ